MKELLKIGDVIDRSTGKQKPERIGKIVIFEPQLVQFYQKGVFPYYKGEGKVLVTSKIMDIEQNDHGLWVTTENSLYRFDNYYEERNTEGGVILG